MFSNDLMNIIALMIFIICILIYSIGLIYKIKKPSWGERGFLNIIYGLWVKRIINPKETLTAIQTMRNLIMVTTFLSSSMLLLLGLLLSGISNESNGLFHLTSTSADLFPQYKFLIFVAVIVFSVIMFLLSLRQMVRFSIIVGIPNESIEDISKNHKGKNSENKDDHYINPEKLKKDVFLRAMNRFTFGMRSVFYGITLILWFINVYAFIIGTISLTIYLILHHDVKSPNKDELPI